MPATPIATSTSPSRHGRPNVSVTTTPSRSTPSRSTSEPRSVSAEPSGSSGSRLSKPSATLDASTPAFAHTKPWRVSAITRSPRFATTRVVSDAMTASRSAAGASLPSAFDTTFCVTTTTSPSLTPTGPSASATMRPRSSPGAISGSPWIGRISIVT
jgi:hypothetical protein